MRPWMKLFAVGGIIGMAFSAVFAGERLINRNDVPPKKLSRPGQLEFYSRGGQAAQELSETPTEFDAEPLTAEVADTPQRFVRQREASAESTATTNKPPRRNLEAELFGDDGESTNPPVRKTTARSTTAKSATGPLKSIEAADVELLPPPTEIRNTIAAARKPSTKTSLTEILQVSGREGTPTPVRTPTSKPSAQFADIEPANGVVEADFQQKPGAKSAVQPVRSEPLPPASAQKASRVSVVNGLSGKPNATNTARGSREALSREHNGVSSNATPQVGTPSVSVEWVKRSEINVGQECLCDLVVKNSGKVSARQVIVEAFFPNSVRLTGSNPEPEQATDHLEWSFPELAAGEERAIHISMIPSLRGELATSANVRFTGTSASVFKVSEPLLKIAVNVPSEVIIGDPLVQTITITNPGTGVAQNVNLHVTTPAGLEHLRSDRSQVEIGALNPGESRTLRLSFTAIASGEQTLEVAATADAGLKQFAEATVNVIAASLNVTVDGPEQHPVGRDARYTVTVANEGHAPTDNVRVSHRIPQGFKFLKADKGGTFDPRTGSVNWSVGHIDPEQTATFKVQLQATDVGHFEHHVTATSEHGLTANAETNTTVDGSAMLALEIQDLEDPVEVGQDTAYEVRVSNTGSKAAQNIGLTFELPRGIELIKVQSVTEHLAKNGLILFNDLPALAPGKTALYRIHVRGQSEGNHRVRARLTSPSIDQELISEEQTKFHAE